MSTPIQSSGPVLPKRDRNHVYLIVSCPQNLGLRPYARVVVTEKTDGELGRSVPIVVIACGALAREIRSVFAQLVQPDRAIPMRYLPAPLHNRPERIPGEIDALIDSVIAQQVSGSAPRFVLGYADCGTGGLLDALIERRRAEGISIVRLPGAHCYEFFAGTETFTKLTEASLGTFYLTDYLALHFDALVWTGLGLDRHPSLRDTYFGNYDRIALISQSHDPLVLERAIAAAQRLALRFEHHHVGLNNFATELEKLIDVQ